MKIFNIIVLLISEFSVLYSYSQSRKVAEDLGIVNHNYYLYSSDDRVYYRNEKSWLPVYYDETILRTNTIMKSNAPFTIIKGKRIFFCPESKQGEALEGLIKKGGTRNKVIRRTGIKAMYADFSFLDSIYKGEKDTIREVWRHADKLHSLLIGTDIEMTADSNYVAGYQNRLVERGNVTRDSILKSIASMSDSITKSSDKVFLYLSLHGIKDKDNKYHFITSDTKYDSLTCRYINSMSADTLHAYLFSFNLKCFCVFIETDNPRDLMQNIYGMDNCCCFLTQRDKKSHKQSIIKDWKDFNSQKIKNPSHIHYYIVETK